MSISICFYPHLSYAWLLGCARDWSNCLSSFVLVLMSGTRVSLQNKKRVRKARHQGRNLKTPLAERPNNEEQTY